MSDRTRRLTLLGQFQLTCGGQCVGVPVGGQRLLACLAVANRPQRREQLAWTLWASHNEAHALANLRTALWRLPRPGGSPLFIDNDRGLELATDVDVDWRRRATQAREVLSGERHSDRDLVDALCADLLPGWYEEWLLPEQERYRQLRLHALEAASALLLAAGHSFEALSAGLLAVACEPLRESAHRCVIAAHLAEGNTSEALRQSNAYLELLITAGLRPTASNALWALLTAPRVQEPSPLG